MSKMRRDYVALRELYKAMGKKDFAIHYRQTFGKIVKKDATALLHKISNLNKRKIFVWGEKSVDYIAMDFVNRQVGWNVTVKRGELNKDFTRDISKRNPIRLNYRWYATVYRRFHYKRECASNFVVREFDKFERISEAIAVAEVTGFDGNVYRGCDITKWVVLIDAGKQKLASYTTSREKAVELGEQRLATATLKQLKITGRSRK